jgi:ABC-2 type transport system permease protein
MLASAAQGDVNSFESLLDAASGESAPVTTAASDQQTSLRNQKWTAFTVGSGFFLFISGMLIVTVASIIYEDKVNNTFTRVQATNVSSVAYVIGVSVAGFVSLMVMVAVYLVYCAVSGLGEIVALPEFGLLCALFVCLCVGFAMVCGLVLKSRSAILWSAVALSTICSLMGGAWFPINYAPDFMQQLAHITPQFWFIDALSQMHDGYAQAWITSTVVIGLYALLCFLIVGIRFASNKSSA